MPIGSILGGIIGANGASAAGSAAGAAGNQAYQNAQGEMSKNREAISPWTSVGGGAVNELGQLYGLGHLTPGGGQSQVLDTSNVAQDRANALSRFQASPGYQFRLQEGSNALDRSAASRGMSLSGAQTRAVQDYGQNIASNEFGNYTNALSGLSGAGESGIQSMTAANAGIFNGGNQDQFQGNMSQAASYQASANALASGISSGINNLASISGFYGPMAGSKGLNLSSFMGGGGGDGAAAVGNYGYGSAAPSTGFGPFAGFGAGGGAAASGASAGAGAGAGGTAAGAGAGLGALSLAAI